MSISLCVATRKSSNESLTESELQEPLESALTAIQPVESKVDKCECTCQKGSDRKKTSKQKASSSSGIQKAHDDILPETSDPLDIESTLDTLEEEVPIKKKDSVKPKHETSKLEKDHSQRNKVKDEQDRRRNNGRREKRSIPKQKSEKVKKVSQKSKQNSKKQLKNRN